MEVRMLLLFILLFASAVLSERPDYDYCSIPTCELNTHVFCQFKERIVANECGVVARSFLSEFEKKVILNLHNHFRWLVYTGKEQRGQNGQQPPAANVTFLEWDTELEDIADRWLVQCRTGYAVCSDVEEFRVHELMTTRSTLNNNEELSIESILWDWYNEVKNYDKDFVQSHRVEEGYRFNTYHYTQIVWGKTRQIGCSALRHHSSGYKNIRFLCIYGPKGNTREEPVY